MNRRQFLQKSFLTISVVAIYNGKVFAKISPIDSLDLLCSDLFPMLNEIDSNSAWYIKNVVLHHSKIDLPTKKFIRNGVKWLNEEAISLYGDIYINLSYEKREAILQNIAQTRWGDSFIYTMLQYILESVLGDPIYGINMRGQGWKWLNHSTGYPRPKKAFL